MTLTAWRRLAIVMSIALLVSVVLLACTKFFLVSLSLTAGSTTYMVGAADGKLISGWGETILPSDATWWDGLQMELPSGLHAQKLDGLSIDWSYTSAAYGGGATHEAIYSVSLMLPCGLLVILAAWSVFRGRVRVGHCPHCGYNLAASPERCPECGSLRKPLGHVTKPLA
jgi:hypothetical protein